MKYINVFETESAFNNASSNLARPQLSLALDNGKVFCLSENSSPAPTVNLVDLGLSVKWADRNVGATCETTEDSWYGDYIAWGETVAKSNYLWDTYEHGTATNLTKYNSTDGKTLLETSDDAATTQNLRMPTVAEWQELLDESKISHETVSSYKGISGLSGIKFTSKITGHTDASIFIPTAGYKTGTMVYRFTTAYWSVNLNASDKTKADIMFVDFLEEISISSQERCQGLPVRGVQ